MSVFTISTYSEGSYVAPDLLEPGSRPIAVNLTLVATDTYERGDVVGMERDTIAANTAGVISRTRGGYGFYPMDTSGTYEAAAILADDITVSVTTGVSAFGYVSGVFKASEVNLPGVDEADNLAKKELREKGIILSAEDYIF